MKRNVYALLASTALLGFDNTGWKKDADGNFVVDADGNPMWGEMSVKGDTISRLNGEAANHRKRAETAEAKLAEYSGIDDPEAARQAIQIAKDIKQGDLINKGKLDEVKAEITKQYEGQITEARRTAEEATQRANNVLLDSAFTGSEFARNRLTEAGLDLARAAFGKQFKVEDGKIVAYDASGNQIYSEKAVGEPASFDEAFEKIISTYKHKDQILKAPDAGGTGGGGGGGARGRGRVVTRSDFDAMNPNDQAATAAAVGKGEAQIVD